MKAPEPSEFLEVSNWYEDSGELYVRAQLVSALAMQSGETGRRAIIQLIEQSYKEARNA